MTLYRNGQEVIRGLRRETYIRTFELLRQKQPEKCSFGMCGGATVFTCGHDTYVLR